MRSMSKTATDAIELRVTISLKGDAVKAWNKFEESYGYLQPSNSQLVEALVLMSLVDGVACKGGRVSGR